MAGYGVAQRKSEKQPRMGRPEKHACPCGILITKSQTLCTMCEDEIFFAAEVEQVENERG
jgi:hypothetical protein